jgi:hypothetical protein
MRDVVKTVERGIEAERSAKREVWSRAGRIWRG